VKHYSDDSSRMQHSVLYFTNRHDKTTGKKESMLILSSPLDGRKIRKSWKVNTIQQFVQFEVGIKLILCPNCCKPVENEVSLEFILFSPSNNVTKCLEFICQNSCFALTSSDQGTEKIVGCENFEHDKICLRKSQDGDDHKAETTVTDNPFSGRDTVLLGHSLIDVEGSKVKENFEPHQQEHQSLTTQNVFSTAYKNFTKPTETCQPTEEDKSTVMQSDSTDRRPRVRTYEEIPYHVNATLQPINEYQPPLTPGTLHKSFVKVTESCEPVKEDITFTRQNEPANIKKRLPQKVHVYEEISLKTSARQGMHHLSIYACMYICVQAS